MSLHGGPTLDRLYSAKNANSKVYFYLQVVGRVKLLSAVVGSKKALFHLTVKNDIAAGSELIAARLC